MMADAIETHGFEPKVVYTHKADLDGVVCAMIARQRFPGVAIVALNYDELDRVTETPCLVMDLDLPGDHPLVHSPLPVPVWIIDHHRAAWYPSESAEPLPVGEFRQYDFDPCEIAGAGTRLYHHPDRCAAVIAMHAFECLPVTLWEWAKLADVADRWLEDDPLFGLARDLTSVVRQSGFEFALEAWSGAAPDAFLVRGMAAAAGAADERANSAALQAAIASAHEEEDHILGLCVAGSVSHVAHGLLEYRREHGLPEKPVALVILQSLLSDSDQMAVGVRGPGALALARRFGGGGHPESAGFQVARCNVVPALVGTVRAMAVITGTGRPAESGDAAAKDLGPPAVGAFAGLEVGSRLILIRDARDCRSHFASAGDEVEVVAVLQPGDADGAIRVPNDGIRVRRVDGGSDREVEFMWDCGRRYFATDGGLDGTG